MLSFGVPNDLAGRSCWVLGIEFPPIAPPAKPTVEWLREALADRGVPPELAAHWAQAEFQARPGIFTGETTPEPEP
jgi:hypothetical protein